MAISLSIKPQGSAEAAWREVPVATLDWFRQVWKPLAERLGLIWVPLFESGLPLPPEDRADVIAELHRLRDAAAALPDETGILPRVDRLLAELEARAADADVELYIG